MFFNGSFEAFRDNCKTLKKGVKSLLRVEEGDFLSSRGNKLILNEKEDSGMRKSLIFA